MFTVQNANIAIRQRFIADADTRFIFYVKSLEMCDPRLYGLNAAQYKKKSQ